jgi:hypothetical protein
MALSDRYCHEDLGVTKAEFNRLLRAIDDGILHESVAFSKRNISMFRYGGMRIDDLIRNWSCGNYQDPFADRAMVLSRREFEDIIDEAYSITQGIAGYEIDGMTVHATFYTNSRHNTWVAIFHFNDTWEVTRVESAHPEAKSPRCFAENIERLIRRLMDERDYP